jgi:hypothetical protein
VIINRVYGQSDLPVGIAINYLYHIIYLQNCTINPRFFPLIMDKTHELVAIFAKSINFVLKIFPKGKGISIFHRFVNLYQDKAFLTY